MTTKNNAAPSGLTDLLAKIDANIFDLRHFEEAAGKLNKMTMAALFNETVATLREARALLAPKAAEQAPVADAARAEPIYQIRATRWPFRPWSDVAPATHEEKLQSDKYECRIVYTAPAQQPARASEAREVEITKDWCIKMAALEPDEGIPPAGMAAAAQQAVTLTDAARDLPGLPPPLTPFGMLVRALRIVAGTTLYEMAKALLTTPAKLSAMEFGRAPVTPEFAFDVSAYFDALGISDTRAAIEAALQSHSEGSGNA